MKWNITGRKRSQLEHEFVGLPSGFSVTSEVTITIGLEVIIVGFIID
ncbi:11003_t:CDS:2 [Rhizophagus irregularis]|nr:11003_t:CDS:2 [Rhizophagus irregularis]